MKQIYNALRSLSVFLFAMAATQAAIAQAPIINTYAGAGSTGYSGDGGALMDAQFNNPTDVAADRAGNVYIADFMNNVIRKITPGGVLSTYAGTGYGAGSAVAGGGYTGDGGPATSAELNGPYALALDTIGNLYFADGYNHMVRRIDTFGIITTFAGKDTAGYSGDGGAASLAKLDNPVGIAIDHSGNVYIADDHNHVVRKVNAAGMISTYAGSDSAGYSGDGGAATLARMNLPIGLAIDAAGNLFIADQNNNNVRKVSPAGIISTYAGTTDTAHGYAGDGGPATGARLYAPGHMAVDGTGVLYIADCLSNLVRMVSTAGIISIYAGQYYGPDSAGKLCEYGGDGAAATDAQMCVPTGVAIGDSGKVYIADRDNNLIRIVAPYTNAGVKTVKSNAQMLQVYPNPSTTGLFTVNLPSYITEPIQVTISNLLGVKVAEYSFMTNKPNTMYLDMAAGVYILSAVTAHGHWNMQLLTGQ